MAAEERTSSRRVALLTALEQEPWRHDFAQALRLLECAYPGWPRLGTSRQPSEDPIRLGQEPSLAFAPSTLASFQRGERDEPHRLAVYFLGLFGPNGPLPLHLTEYARQRARTHGDSAFARFADLFHHRMLSFFYRAWASSRPALQFDRPESDRVALYVGSFTGRGPKAFRQRDAFPDLAKLHYAGRLALQSRNVEGLEAMLADFLEVAVEVEPFRGVWLPIPEPMRWRLGESAEIGRLGVSTTVGAKTWDRQLGFRLHAGPLGVADYHRLLPGTPSSARLAALVRNYAGDEWDWDLVLILRRAEVPELRLGGPEQLGWTTWLASRPPEHDPRDVVLRPAILASACRGATGPLGEG